MNPPDQPTPYAGTPEWPKPFAGTPTGIIGETCGQPLHDLVHRTPTLAPTPRTDAEKCKMNICMTSVELEAVPADFARTLERELAAAQAECERLNDGLKMAEAMVRATTDRSDTFRAELATAKAETSHYMAVAQKATDELIFFRADNLKAHQMTCAAGLERDSLRAEVERLKGMRTAAEAIMTDVAEANEEIAIARAEKAEAELAKRDSEYLRGTAMVAESASVWQSRAEKAEAELAAIEEDGTEEHNAAVGLRQKLVAALDRAEKAEAALAFIAENGGTKHETECGTISCNGSWCAEQARAAIKGTP
jgi:hypothetical protein